MTRAPTRRQDGFTLIEVMVAITILLVGVLGTVTMIDGANSVTARTKAREGATALARSVLEIGRGIPYRELTAARVLTELEGRAGFADASASAGGHQISSRGFTYTVTPAVCAMDDPKDNLGSHDEEGIAFCAESDGPADPAVDRNADDYRRVSVQLSWTPTSTQPESVKQTGIVTNPVGGLGPSVTELEPDSPATTTISTTVEDASYDVTTSAAAQSVSWSINGSRLGFAEGSGTAWEFTWELGDPDTPTFVDCTYVVQAEAFDDKGRAGAPRALTVTLNRRVPFAPTGLAGGRNLNGDADSDYVDVQWNPNPECDIQGYEVYRGTAPAAVTTLVCEVDAGDPTECVDDDAPQTGTLYYEVLAVEATPGGGTRDGDRAGPLVVDDANTSVPGAPADFTVCTGGNPDCNDIDGNPAPTGSPVLSWSPSTDADDDAIAFYRVYRDGATYADRLDVLFPVPGKPLVFVDDTAGSAHTYFVSAVDDRFGESPLTPDPGAGGGLAWP